MNGNIANVLPDRFEPPENDHISSAFKDLVPKEYEGSDRYLDIVTWNIRYFNDHDEKRVELITDILDQLNGDIFVLEEIKHDSLDVVKENLEKRDAGNYEVVYGSTGGNQRVAFMYDLDWVIAKDDIEELFGKRTVLTGEGKDAFPRLPLKGYFTALSEVDEPFDFQLLGLHLKSQRGGGESQRRLAAERLKSWLVTEAPQVDSDVIMIGDWNEPPSANAWKPFRELERDNRALFERINNESSISHLMYKNKQHLGSRLDMATVSMAAVPEMKQPPKVVRWKSLDELLDRSPKAKEIKAYLKKLREKASDHMPVVTRFFFKEQD